MARELRVDVPGAIHHVTTRGNRRQLVCADDDDYARFRQLLDVTRRRFGWNCHAWCVMPNHLHLLVETPRAGLSAGMQRLLGLYAQWFNERRKIDGHLFQGRFRSKLVESEEYFAEVERYIATNPVAAGLCLDAAD